jgi:hypothetical protein
MLALREVAELEKRSFVEKLYYVWILTFNILNKFLASILVRLIIDIFAPIQSQSLVSSITFHIHLISIITMFHC